MKNKWYNDTWWKRLLVILTFPIWTIVGLVWAGLAETVDYIRE